MAAEEHRTIFQELADRLLGVAKVTDGSYRAFTRKYDIVTAANALDDVLQPLGKASVEGLDENWREFSEARGAWKTRIAVAALNSTERVVRLISRQARKDTIVSLLVDLSGSMRGEKILLATAAVDAAQDYLGGLDVRCEILGFTTQAWNGGRARRDWLRSGMPPRPGRLNELLHIVFKSEDDERRSSEGWDLRQMLRPRLHKENIDGEAIEWAIGRLRESPATRKILLVISDGVPADDATFAASGLNYLEDHLKSVVSAAKAAGDVEIAALGIGYAVGRYYERSVRIDTPSDIGEHLINLIEQTLVGERTEAT